MSIAKADVGVGAQCIDVALLHVTLPLEANCSMSIITHQTTVKVECDTTDTDIAGEKSATGDHKATKRHLSL
jgi:hypothetical protein